MTAYQRAKQCARCLIATASQAQLSRDSARRAAIEGQLALEAAHQHRLTSAQTTRLFKALRLR